MKTLSILWNSIQSYLFPTLNEELGELTKRQQKFITVMETIEIGNLLNRFDWIGNGRKPKERFFILKCFIALENLSMQTPDIMISEERIGWSESAVGITSSSVSGLEGKY